VFTRFLTVADSCDACGLDFGFADPADGPAFFVMTGVGFLVMAAWAAWAVAVQPPIWAQFAVVLPAIVLGCLLTLRPMKGWLIAEQYVRKAEAARWASSGSHGKAPKRYNRRGF
jgi:uncharacterized protein (DUF983 family)